MQDTHLDRVSEGSEPKPRAAPPAASEGEAGEADTRARRPRSSKEFTAPVTAFFSKSFFRTDTELVLPGPGCEPLATDFGYERTAERL